MMTTFVYIFSALIGFALGFVVCALLAGGSQVEYIYVEDDGEGGIQQMPAPDSPTSPTPDYVPEAWTPAAPRVSQR